MSANTLPAKNEEYATREYWDRRYAQETEDAAFDWFKRYEDVTHFFRQVLPDRTAQILMLGCGNSTLSEDVCFILHHQEIGASSGYLGYDSVQGLTVPSFISK